MGLLFAVGHTRLHDRGAGAVPRRGLTQLGCGASRVCLASFRGISPQTLQRSLPGCVSQAGWWGGPGCLTNTLRATRDRPWGPGPTPAVAVLLEVPPAPLPPHGSASDMRVECWRLTRACGPRASHPHSVPRDPVSQVPEPLALSLAPPSAQGSRDAHPAPFAGLTAAAHVWACAPAGKDPHWPAPPRQRPGQGWGQLGGGGWSWVGNRSSGSGGQVYPSHKVLCLPWALRSNMS